MKNTSTADSANHIDHEEFLRRVKYRRRHLEAVARMMEDGRDCGEALSQMRELRRAAEKLEAQCLLSHLTTDDGDALHSGASGR